MRDEILIVNQKALTPRHKAEQAPYEYYKQEITPRADFDQCYVAVYELPPGCCNYPRHYHTANTEVFFILSGQGLLEQAEGSRPVNAGDFVVCPPGEGGLHRLQNTSQAEPLRYIDFDTTHSPDVVHYPDEGKTGVIVHNQSSTFFKNASAVPYYDGEEKK